VRFVPRGEVREVRDVEVNFGIWDLCRAGGELSFADRTDVFFLIERGSTMLLPPSAPCFASLTFDSKGIRRVDCVANDLLLFLVRVMLERGLPFFT